MKNFNLRSASSVLLAISVFVFALFSVLSLAPQRAMAVVVPSFPFSDGFETGNFVNWSSFGAWSAVKNATGAHSGLYRADITGNISNTSLSKNISTVGYGNISLSFWYKINKDLENSDHVIVEWTSNGATWNQLADYTNLDSGDWKQVFFSLPTGANNSANFSFRFRATLNSNSDEFSLDDVFLSGLVLDTTSPTVSITGAPANWVNTSQTATVACTDSGSGCNTNSYKIKIYNTLNPGSCSTNYSDYALASPQTVASHLWICGAAKDNAGNYGFSAPVEFKIDKLSPVLSEVAPVPSLTNNNAPSYTFNSNKPGAITYGGDCSSATAGAILGNNTITFNTLADGTHSNCTLSVTDIGGNTSLPLAISPFTIDTAVPVLHLPADITADATNTDGAVVTYTATADDANPAHPDVTCTPASGSTFAVGTNLVTCSATDTAGNTAGGSFNVNVKDFVAPSCVPEASQMVLSDTSTMKDGEVPTPAVLVSPINSRWTADIPGAKWIWGENPITDSTIQTIENFYRTFNIGGTPNGATLYVAADNAYSVSINDHFIGADSTGFNYQKSPADDGSSGQDTYSIPTEDLISGTNKITFSVTNFPDSDSTPISNPAGLLYKLVTNGNGCLPPPPAPTTLKVHIYKYLKDGDSAPAQIPDDTLITYQFPMTATWNSANLGSGTGNYALGYGHGGSEFKYGADTSEMYVPADYTTYERTSDMDSDSLVLPAGAECIPGKYRLIGYKDGDSLASAQSAQISTTAPDYKGLTADKYEIVVNEKCPDAPAPTNDTTPPPVPTLLFPANNSVVKPSALILDWSDVVDDASNPVTYYYESAHDGATTTDNALANPIYNSGQLSVSQIDGTGTADGVYFWQVKACDSVGNCSAWSDPWKVTVDSTVPISDTDITAPVSFIVSPNSDSSFEDDFITISGTTTDSGGVASTTLAFAPYTEGTDGGAGSCGDYTDIVSLTNSSGSNSFDWSYNWTPDDGTYCIKAHGEDLAGNKEASPFVMNIKFKKKVVPPVVPPVEPVPPSGGGGGNGPVAGSLGGGSSAGGTSGGTTSGAGNGAPVITGNTPNTENQNPVVLALAQTGNGGAETAGQGNAGTNQNGGQAGNAAETSAGLNGSPAPESNNSNLTASAIAGSWWLSWGFLMWGVIVILIVGAIMFLISRKRKGTAHDGVNRK